VNKLERPLSNFSVPALIGLLLILSIGPQTQDDMTQSLEDRWLPALKGAPETCPGFARLLAVFLLFMPPP
jgi:hypothetical protein